MPRLTNAQRLQRFSTERWIRPVYVRFTNAGLADLVEAGLLETRQSAPTPEHNGHTATEYRLTALGQAIVNAEQMARG